MDVPALPPQQNVMVFMLWLLAILTKAAADEFIIPTNTANDLSLRLVIGQTIQVSWQTQLDSLTLIVSRWGGNAVGTLLSDELNTGTFEWTIGENDNIDDKVIKENPNFVLLIRDPSGETTDGGGFVNGQLSSRAFIIESNQTTSSTTSSSASSTTTDSPSSTPPPASPTSAESSEQNTVGGLSTGAKAGIGAGVGAVALIAIGAGIWLGIRRWRDARRRRASTPPQMSSRYEVEGSTDFYKSHGRPSETGHKPAQESAIEMPAPWARSSRGVHEIGDGT